MARRWLTRLTPSRLVSILGIAGVVIAMSCRDGRVPAPSPDLGPGLEQLVIGGETFTLELAADGPTRELGMMHRASIDPRGGMLFVFPDSEVRSFWMKDCIVDMDLIYLDPFGRVTALHTMEAQPPRGPDETLDDYEWRMHLTARSSRLPAQFAIELEAGSIARLGIRVDDRIDLDVRRLRALAR